MKSTKWKNKCDSKLERTDLMCCTCQMEDAAITGIVGSRGKYRFLQGLPVK